MILVDLNQVLISNLMAQIRGKADVKPNKEMIRHMVLNSLRGFNVKFREEFGVDATFPRVVIDGSIIGGCRDTVEYLLNKDMF